MGHMGAATARDDRGRLGTIAAKGVAALRSRHLAGTHSRHMAVLDQLIEGSREGLRFAELGPFAELIGLVGELASADPTRYAERLAGLLKAISLPFVRGAPSDDVHFGPDAVAIMRQVALLLVHNTETVANGAASALCAHCEPPAGSIGRGPREHLRDCRFLAASEAPASLAAAVGAGHSPKVLVPATRSLCSTPALARAFVAADATHGYGALAVIAGLSGPCGSAQVAIDVLWRALEAVPADAARLLTMADGRGDSGLARLARTLGESCEEVAAVDTRDMLALVLRLLAVLSENHGAISESLCTTLPESGVVGAVAHVFSMLCDDALVDAANAAMDLAEALELSLRCFETLLCIEQQFGASAAALRGALAKALTGTAKASGALLPMLGLGGAGTVEDATLYEAQDRVRRQRPRSTPAPPPGAAGDLRAPRRRMRPVSARAHFSAMEDIGAAQEQRAPPLPSAVFLFGERVGRRLQATALITSVRAAATAPRAFLDGNGPACVVAAARSVEALDAAGGEDLGMRAWRGAAQKGLLTIAALARPASGPHARAFAEVLARLQAIPILVATAPVLACSHGSRARLVQALGANALQTPKWKGEEDVISLCSAVTALCGGASTPGGPWEAHLSAFEEADGGVWLAQALARCSEVGCSPVTLASLMGLAWATLCPGSCAADGRGAKAASELLRDFHAEGGISALWEAAVRGVVQLRPALCSLLAALLSAAPTMAAGVECATVDREGFWPAICRLWQEEEACRDLPSMAISTVPGIGDARPPPITIDALPTNRPRRPTKAGLIVRGTYLARDATTPQRWCREMDRIASAWAASDGRIRLYALCAAVARGVEGTPGDYAPSFAIQRRLEKLPDAAPSVVAQLHLISRFEDFLQHAAWCAVHAEMVRGPPGSAGRTGRGRLPRKTKRASAVQVADHIVGRGFVPPAVSPEGGARPCNFPGSRLSAAAAAHTCEPLAAGRGWPPSPGRRQRRCPSGAGRGWPARRHRHCCLPCRAPRRGCRGCGAQRKPWGCPAEAYGQAGADGGDLAHPPAPRCYRPAHAPPALPFAAHGQDHGARPRRGAVRPAHERGVSSWPPRRILGSPAWDRCDVVCQRCGDADPLNGRRRKSQ